MSSSHTGFLYKNTTKRNTSKLLSTNHLFYSTNNQIFDNVEHVTVLPQTHSSHVFESLWWRLIRQPQYINRVKESVLAQSLVLALNLRLTVCLLSGFARARVLCDFTFVFFLRLGCVCWISQLPRSRFWSYQEEVVCGMPLLCCSIEVERRWTNRKSAKMKAGANRRR